MFEYVVCTCKYACRQPFQVGCMRASLGVWVFARAQSDWRSISISCHYQCIKPAPAHTFLQEQQHILHRLDHFFPRARHIHTALLVLADRQLTAVRLLDQILDIFSINFQKCCTDGVPKGRGQRKSTMWACVCMLTIH